MLKVIKATSIVILIMMAATVSHADEILWGTAGSSAERSTFNFGTGDVVDTISRAVQSCPTMSVTFFQATAAQVTLYEADPGDDTAVSLSTSVIAYSATSTSPHTFRPGKQFVRFKVVQAETSGTSVAVVNCINEVGSRVVPIWERNFQSANNASNRAINALNGSGFPSQCSNTQGPT